MGEIEKLKERLKEYHNIGVTWGDEAHKLTAEQRAAEINRVLDLVESGQCKEIFDVENFLEFDSQEQCHRFYKKYPQPFLNTFGLDWQEDIDSVTEYYVKQREEYDSLLQERFKEFMEEEKKST